MPDPETPAGPVNVVTPSGRTITVDPETAQNLIQQGGRPESGLEGDAAAQASAEAARYDNPVAAAGLGALRALTFGSSDAIAASLGADYYVGKIKEHNPVGSLVGEVGGALVPIGAPGLVAKAAKAAGNAVRGTSTAGKIAAGVIEGAVDGGAWNAAQQVSSAALTGDPLTPEKIAASIGTGALFGGAIGGGLSGVAAATGAVRKKLAGEASPLLNVRSQGAKDLGKHYGQALKEVDDGIEDAFQSAKNRRAEEIELEVGGFGANPEKYGHLAPDQRDIGQVFDDLDAVSKPRSAQDDIATGAGSKKAKNKPRKFDEVETADTMLSEPSAPRPQADVLPGESAFAYGHRKAGEELAELRTAYKSARKAVEARFGDDLAIDLAALSRKPLAQALKSIDALDAYVKVLQDIHVASGSPVPDLLANVRAKVSPEVSSAFDGLSKMNRAGLADVLRVDVDKLPTYGPVAENVLKAYGVARYADNTASQAAVGAAEAKLAAAETRKQGGLFGLGKLQAAAQAASLLSMARPAHVLMKLATMAGKVSGQLAEGVDKFIQVAAGPKVRKAYVRSGTAIFNQVRFSEHEDKNDGRSPAVRRIHELQELQGNPGRLEAFVDDQLAPLRAHNQDLGFAVADQLKARVNFVARKAPRLAPPDPFTGWQEEPSKAELSAWARYIEAAEKGPAALLEELNSGDLAPETVETVKELYPGLFEKVQEMIIERVIDAKKPVRYEDRVNLSQLFDVPVEPTQAPETVHAIQEMYALQAEQQEAVKPRGTPKPPSMTKGQQFS